MLDKIVNFFTGGLANTVMDGIKSYLPPDMSEEQKASLNLELQKIELQKTIELNKAVSEAEKAINERISLHEGTAKDLCALPFVGRIIIFARDWSEMSKQALDSKWARQTPERANRHADVLKHGSINSVYGDLI